MADDRDDQGYTQHFWHTFAMQLMRRYGEANPGSSGNPNWFMPAAQALIAEFAAQSGGNDSGAAPSAAEITNFNLALYDFANRIPQWTVSWSGNSDNELFPTYKDYVSQLHTNPVLSGAARTNAQTQLQQLKQQLADFNSKVSGIKAKFCEDYEAVGKRGRREGRHPEDSGRGQLPDEHGRRRDQHHDHEHDHDQEAERSRGRDTAPPENTPDDDSNNTTWLPGFSAATMMKAWNRHRTSAAYKKQLQALTRAEARDLSAITKQIFTLQNEIYGPGFNAIQAGQSDVLKADPDFPNKFDDDTQRAVFQMPAGSDGWLPRYEVQGGDNAVLLQKYKKWLAAAQAALVNGEKPKYAFSLQSNQLEQQTGDAKLSFNAAAPIADILMLDVSGSGQYTSAGTQDEVFSLNLTYQDLFLMPVQPGRHWFNNSMIKEYGRPEYFTQGSPFTNGPLGGPNGLLNLQVNGVLVGVGRKVEFTSQKFKEYDWSNNLNASVGVSILGLIHLGGGSVSESYSPTSMEMADTGFVIRDTSGTPSVVGLLVQEIFPEGS
jgi:hypothetical protein